MFQLKLYVLTRPTSGALFSESRSNSILVPRTAGVSLYRTDFRCRPSSNFHRTPLSCFAGEEFGCLDRWNCVLCARNAYKSSLVTSTKHRCVLVRWRKLHISISSCVTMASAVTRVPASTRLSAVSRMRDKFTNTHTHWYTQCTWCTEVSLGALQFSVQVWTLPWNSETRVRKWVSIRTSYAVRLYETLLHSVTP